MGYIYKITNKINNKIYIGYTTLTIEDRWKTHLKAAYSSTSKDRNALFKKAIRKYKPKNFLIEEIEQLDNIEDLKTREIYWIKYYHSYAFEENSWGYNSTKGGDGVHGFGFPIVQFDIISGKQIAKYVSIKDAERAIGCRIEGIGQKDRTSKGCCFLYEHDIEDLSEKDLIALVHSLYPTLVYQLDKEGTFIALYRNTVEAAKAIHCSIGNLVMCCEGKRRMVKGFQTVYQKDIENRLGQPMAALPIRGLAVTQYKLNGEKLKNEII